MKVIGKNGEIEFDGTIVRVKRGIEGKAAIFTTGIGFQGEKKIPLEQVVSVTFKAPTTMLVGYFQVVTIGYTPPRNLNDVVRDENTVTFIKKDLSEFEALRDELEHAIANKPSSAAVGESPLDALKKLKELLDLGVISNEEFEEKKSALMKQI